MSRKYWLWHAVLPGALFAAVLASFATSTLDIDIASAWAYDAASGGFIGSGPGEWWAKDIIHTGGGLAIRILGAAVAIGLAWVSLTGRLHAWRRPLSYLVIAGVVAVGSVGLLRATSNVDCPWSLDRFGGTRPYIHLFGDRPDNLPRARCFPGGHSSSGFALFAFYFLFAGRRPGLASLSLGVALAVGCLFSWGQEARGAHFLSHDLWSAAFAWFGCLTVYWLGYKGNVWNDAPLAAVRTSRAHQDWAQTAASSRTLD